MADRHLARFLFDYEAVGELMGLPSHLKIVRIAQDPDTVDGVVFWIEGNTLPPAAGHAPRWVEPDITQPGHVQLRDERPGERPVFLT